MSKLLATVLVGLALIASLTPAAQARYVDANPSPCICPPPIDVI